MAPVQLPVVPVFQITASLSAQIGQIDGLVQDCSNSSALAMEL